MNALKPKVTIPVHYLTAKSELPIAPVDDFITGKSNVKNVNASVVEIGPSSLPNEPEIVVLAHAL